MTYIRAVAAVLTLAGATLALRAEPVSPQDPPPQPPPSQSSVRIVISGPPGLPPRLAVPDFIALSTDAETIAAAKLMGQVLWDDLQFEKEFYLAPRDTYRTIPAPRSVDEVPVERWKELGIVDGVVAGSVQRTAGGFVVRMRLVQIPSGQSALAKEYSGKTDNARIFAHTISDDIHMQHSGLQGVARTQIAFTSDRAGDRIKGPVGDRSISNVYVVDYDGAHERRVSAARTLELSPTWSPDLASIAYTSYRTGFPDVVIQSLRGGGLTRPAGGNEKVHNILPVWAPDGSRLAFSSNRDGNPEIYVVNRDGSGLRRLTNHPEIDVTPTWSPTGQQIAWTSNRGGNPNIWIMNADGSQPRQLTREGHADRATWSPAPLNEIAYTSRRGGGFDIKIYEFATGAFRTLTTDGIGSNEQPSFSPTGRHLAFSSNRAGREQIFTIARDGTGLRQITRTGNNKYPNWSPIRRAQ